MKSLKYLIFYVAIMPLFFSVACEDDMVLDAEPTAINAAIGFPSGPFFSDCPVGLTATAINGANFTWEVSDGQRFSGSDISVSFTAPGSYALTLKADFEGRTEEVMRTITVINTETNTFTDREENSHTQLIGVKALPNGEFVTVGSFCKETFNSGRCKVEGVMVRWHAPDGTVVKLYKSPNINVSYIPKGFTVLRNGDVAVVSAHRSFEPAKYRAILLKFNRNVGVTYLKTKTIAGKDLIPFSVVQSTGLQVAVGAVSMEPSGGNQRSEIIVFSGPSEPEVISIGAPATRTGIHSIVMLDNGEYYGLADFGGGVALARSSDQDYVGIGSSGYTPISIEKGLSSPLLTVTAKPEEVRIRTMNERGRIIDATDIDLPGVTVLGSSLMANGNILISGRKRVGDGNYGYLAEVSMWPEIIWEKQYDDFGGNLLGAAESPDCGFVAAGFITNGGGSRDQAYFQKTKPEGEL